MNSHVKRWIDSIVSEYPVGHEFLATTVREQLVSERGTTFVVDNSAIGWYLNRKDNIISKDMNRGRRTYVRI
tara:strand:- start:294 stop:509 length:216 start_codon:yes stop_codon:yes gene_type:complete